MVRLCLAELLAAPAAGLAWLHLQHMVSTEPKCTAAAQSTSHAIAHVLAEAFMQWRAQKLLAAKLQCTRYLSSCMSQRQPQLFHQACIPAAASASQPAKQHCYEAGIPVAAEIG